MIELILNNIKEEIKLILERKGVTEVGEVFFEVPKDTSHGDYSTNIAMKMAKSLRKAPYVIANEIIENIDLKQYHLKSMEVAGAGFINLFLDREYLANVVFTINSLNDKYGCSSIGNNEKVLLEYVSANPTGYLHIGHGRGAAYGDSLSRIMKKAGYQVTREHYVNDAGNQIHNLTISIKERFKELYGYECILDENSYHGKEIIKVAQLIKDSFNELECVKLLNGCLNDDKDVYYDTFRKFGLEFLLDGLKKDLKDFNVEFDNWFSEKSLYDNGFVSKTIDKLKEVDAIYEQDGAIWLKTSIYGDEKDRVIIKSDGTYTYLLPDIAYHANKLSRGFDRLIDVLGADHHGYIDRLKAAITFVGGDASKVNVEILQMVRAIQNGEEVKMSKRSGKSITLRDLIDEVGTDALRYMYISKSLSTHMDLDLDLAVKQNNENPVFYVQYAYARISSLFSSLENRNIKFIEVKKFEIIDIEKISKIIMVLLQYKAYVEEAATKLIPHKIAQYAYNLATVLHSFYNDEKIICDDILETNEKLTLLKAVQIVLKDSLSLIGVNVRERM